MNMGNRVLVRIVAVFIAQVIMAFGVALMKISLFGNDPFNCMSFGISELIGYEYSVCAISVNCLLFVLVVLFSGKRYLNIGTVANMLFFPVVLGTIYPAIMGMIVTEPADMVIRLTLLFTGVVIICYGASMYMCSDMGMGPYDAAGWVIQDVSKGKIQFRFARIALDMTSVFVGFMTGTIVSLGTMVMAFFTGPLVVWFTDHINYRLIYGIEKENV